ncbi:MAG: ROK family protein [Dehalococcoidia bacterium]|nr:ROK family protein [Dehalococcoidia bacterium]
MAMSLAVVADIGGTKVLAAVVAADGTVLGQAILPTEAQKGPEVVIGRVIEGFRLALDKAGLGVEDVVGAGIACAGLVDVDKGVVVTSPNLLGWDRVPLRGRIEAALGLNTFLANDANAAALGEHRFGAGQGSSSLVFVTVSTGIGGGLVLGGRLYTGAWGTAGEVGHMTVEASGPQCACGQQGCLEVLASGTAMAREARRRLEAGGTSRLLELSGGHPEAVTAELIGRAAREGDGLAREVAERAATYLGIGLGSLVNLLNPEVIVVGGGVSRMGEMLLAPARATMLSRAFPSAIQGVRLVQGSLGGMAGALGMASYVMEAVQHSR